MEITRGTTAERTTLVPDAAHLGALLLAAELTGTRIEVESSSSFAEMHNAALRYQSRVPEADREGARDQAMMAMFAGGAVVWLAGQARAG